MSKKDTAPTGATIPTLETITGMKPGERIELYQRCDSEMRSRFLIQGKVLHVLGDAGEDQLRKAGVPSSSLSNARYAALALALADGKRKIHTGKKAEPFTEEIYDTLTLEQCVLLAYGSTYRGSARTVKHRPSLEQFDTLIKLPKWSAELESWFEHGMTTKAHAEHVKQQEANAKKVATSTPPAPEAEEAPPEAFDAPPPPPPIVHQSAPSAQSEPVAEEVDDTENTGETGDEVKPRNVVEVPHGTFNGPPAPPAPPVETAPPQLTAIGVGLWLETMEEKIDTLNATKEEREAIVERLLKLGDRIIAGIEAKPKRKGKKAA
jgi:hypothetical protein